MSEISSIPEPSAAAPVTVPQRPPRARPYLKLLWLIPGLAMLATGLFYHYNIEEGGEVDAIRLTTRRDMVGQAAEALANVDPGTPDLYLKVTIGEQQKQLPPQKDTPIGNGLTWNLDQPTTLHEVKIIEVWDHTRWWKDKYLDRITLNGWSADGQRFHIDLLGRRNEPPKWAMPVAAVGGAITLLALLRFVWDQVI